MHLFEELSGGQRRVELISALIDEMTSLVRFAAAEMDVSPDGVVFTMWGVVRICPTAVRLRLAPALSNIASRLEHLAGGDPATFARLAATDDACHLSRTAAAVSRIDGGEEAVFSGRPRSTNEMEASEAAAVLTLIHLVGLCRRDVI